MTFPTITYTSTSTSSAGTSHIVIMPSPDKIDAGDLILIFFATDGDNTITDWGGCTNLGQESNGTTAFGAVGYKIAVGNEDVIGSITITTSVSEPSSHCVYIIQGHECDTLPPEISTVVEGASLYPDSTSITPSWSQDDTLFISAEMNDSLDLVSVYPTNYTLSQLNANGGGNQDCGVAVCGRNYNNPSDDPPVYTLAGSEQWVAWTVAVPPDGAAAAAEFYTGKGIDRGINRGIL